MSATYRGNLDVLQQDRIAETLRHDRAPIAWRWYLTIRSTIRAIESTMIIEQRVSYYKACT